MKSRWATVSGSTMWSWRGNKHSSTVFTAGRPSERPAVVSTLYLQEGLHAKTRGWNNRSNLLFFIVAGPKSELKTLWFIKRQRAVSTELRCEGSRNRGGSLPSPPLPAPAARRSDAEILVLAPTGRLMANIFFPLLALSCRNRLGLLRRSEHFSRLWTPAQEGKICIYIMKRH